MCIQVGYLTSYWNVPYYPEWCRDSTMDSSVAFDTTIRVAGSWSSFGASFREIMSTYGWHRAVVASDTALDSSCYYGAASINEAIGDVVVGFLWIRMADEPTDDELEDYLDQIRNRSRGTVVT